MEIAELVKTVVIGEADLIYRGSLMKAAADGDREAQRELRWRYDVWVYSPDERDAFMQRRDHREASTECSWFNCEAVHFHAKK